MHIFRKIKPYLLWGTFCMVSMFTWLDVCAKDTTVQQNIRYYTSRAKEMIFIWTINEWTLPSPNLVPPDSYIKEGMVYSKMKFNEDHFSLQLALPKGSYINYMFWATKDSIGNGADGWDTNWGSNYNTRIDGDGKNKIIDDGKLDFVKLDKIKTEKVFDIQKNGKPIFFISIGLLFLILLVYYLKLKRWKWPTFRLEHFFIGLCLALFFLIIMTRLQMNGYVFSKQFLVFGVSFFDLLFLFIVALVFFWLLHLCKKNKILKGFVAVIFFLLIVGITVFNLLNIEIVRQLGHPINYKWLYYSDFLKATDAKNALKANLNTGLNNNLILIVISVLPLGYAIGTGLQIFRDKFSRLAISLIVFAILFLGFGFYQVQKFKFDQGKIDNPILVLGQSWLASDKKPGIFSKKIDEKVYENVLKMHTESPLDKINYADSINNIVLFVMESTPHSKVQVYDSTFRVTENLNSWSREALIFDNMYGHLPNTVSSIFSICTGRYPMISYKAFINEYPTHSIQTLPALLKQNGWNTSLFFSSDLTYSNIGRFTESHGFDRSEDMKTIPCKYEKFETNFAQMDGLDDRCIVNRYFGWKDSLKGKKNFSVVWANQTHYPYFSKNKASYSTIPELNGFLNSLKNVDQAFGQLMEGLKQRGEIKNTLVIVVGDHGESFGTHNQYSHGSRIYEENLHVPCFLINPVLFSGSRDKRISGLVDIAPTVLHFAGIKRPEDWQGNSLLAKTQKSHTFMVGPFSDFLLGSRFDKWKLIYNVSNQEFELFDLSKDPLELKNVAESNNDLIKKEYEILLGWAQYHDNLMDKLIGKKK